MYIDFVELFTKSSISPPLSFVVCIHSNTCSKRLKCKDQGDQSGNTIMKLSIPRLLLSIGTNNSSVWNIVLEHSIVSVFQKGAI